MKRQVLVLLTSIAIAASSAAVAEMVDVHKVFLPTDIKWAPAPASLPAGAEAALLYGDLSKQGMFALRIKAPRGYRIPPHTHAQDEVITIISGKLRLGMGPKADRDRAEALPAGSLSAMPSGASHYVFIEDDSVVQINATGPWNIDYVDPRDDPRLNVAPTEQKGGGQRPD
jgi:quercetin dioxygenase-like cupin family protein